MFIFIGIILLIIGLLANATVNHFRIVASRYTIESAKIDKDVTFVQISDYHSNDRQSEKLVEMTKKEKPDYILLSGDILSSEDLTTTVDFVSGLVGISQVVYARGNHDDDFESYDDFCEALEKLGVIVLNNASYEAGGINFIGLEDFSEVRSNRSEVFDALYLPYIKSYKKFIKEDSYNLMLGHRPNYLDAYAEIDVDLVVSGHAHGGQWQIPFTNIGILAPDEGLFPRHVEGLKRKGNTYQVISTGTSNPYGPYIPRFFNPEEIVVITVKAKK